jgi:HEAT repeat protein
LIAVAFAALEAGRGFGEIGADTIVLSTFGAGVLPYLFIGLGATSLVAALLYGAALGRIPRVQLLAGLPLAAAAILLVERVLMATGHPASIALAWLTVYAVGAIGVTIAWTMAGSVFDSRQARRLFPLATAAAIAGSFFGTLLAGPVARAVGTESLIVLEAGLLSIVAGAIVGLWRTTTVRQPPVRRDRSLVADLRVGFDEVVRSPLMRLVAVAYVLLAILMFSVTYPFLLAASETFTNEADLATFLGLLSAAVTGTSFLVSVVLANRVYARIGVTGAALLLPVVYLLGFGLWIVAFSMATAALVRFTQQVTQRGLSNAAYTAFYNVVPSERRAQTLAFNDGVPNQIGTMLSGVLLLASGTLLARDQVFWLGAIAAVACTIVVVAIRRDYAASLVRTLRSGLGEQVLEGGPGLVALTQDPAVTLALVDALHAPEPGVRSMAAGMLGRTSVEGAGPALVEAVDDDPDPAVRAAALDALAELGGPPTAAAAAEAVLSDPDARVRVAALRAIGAVVHEPNVVLSIPIIEELATDPEPAVRAAVACLYGAVDLDAEAEEIVAGLLDSPDEAARAAGLVALRRLGRRVPAGIARESLSDRSPRVRAAALDAIAAGDGADAPVDIEIEALDDDAAVVRSAAARALRARHTVPPEVFEVLSGPSARAQDAALVALDGHGPEVRDWLITWTLGRLERASVLRRVRLATTTTDGNGNPETPTDPTLAFLLSVLAGRERRAEELALRSIVLLGAPEADGVIRRCLRSPDPETRAQAIEALDSIGDHDLSGALVRHLEVEADTAQIGPAAVAHLVDDDDPWIAQLAWRVLDGGSDVPETSRTLGDLETMLALRGVPLFERLDPEDLQRIAMHAAERYYLPGESLVRENELGDSLVVIVEGRVRVVHIEADGEERFIRRYERGDHIGELAVLRESPRAATVIAEGDGVRGLVIAGASLRAILRERPEAAMAMLATLAERISTQ